MAHYNTVFAQLLKLVPRHEFEKLANACDGKVRANALSRWTQFTTLMMAHLTGRHSLRDIENAQRSHKAHHYHLNCQSVSKSALARANEHRDYQFFADLFQLLYQRCASQSPRHGFRFKAKLFSLDASLLDVSAKLFPYADYNQMKAAFKLHVGLDHDGLIPAFAQVTLGKVSDIEKAREFNFPKGSVVVFDKGYGDYAWHDSLTKQGIFWITRKRSNAKYRVLSRHPIPQNSGVTSDQIIEYTSDRSGKKSLAPVRRIGYCDPETGHRYEFITNHFEWSAQTIADIYKQRWQVELFFKWIKQNLKIKSFLGNSKNAVLTQVLIALCAYLLLAFLKFKSKISISLQQIIRLLQVHLFSKYDLLALLKLDKYKIPEPSPQMALALVRS